MAVGTPEFPCYEVRVNGKLEFMSLQKAGVTMDTGWAHVQIGDLVVEADGTTRQITEEEKQQLNSIADEHSASK